MTSESVAPGTNVIPSASARFDPLTGSITTRLDRSLMTPATSRPTVYSFVLYRCGGVGSVAQEVTQEAFVEAVRHRDRFDGRSSPLTWVCGIARHKLADHFRRLARDKDRAVDLVAVDNRRVDEQGGAEGGADSGAYPRLVPE